MIRPFATVAVALAALAACSSPSSGGGDDGSPDGGASLDGGSCAPPASDADAGEEACSAARAFVSCTDGTGAGCVCLSDDPTTCADCPLTGATCTNRCGPGEYAVACGGPPGPNADGGTIVYEPVPTGCAKQAPTPSGVVFACCPCP